MKRLVALFLFFFIGVVGLFAQDVIEPPTDIVQFIGAISTYLGSWVGVAIAFPFLVATILGLFNLDESNKAMKYVITGLVGAGLVVAAHLFPFGYLYGALWWWLIANWIGLMLTEIFAYVLLEEILDEIALKLNPWKTS